MTVLITVLKLNPGRDLFISIVLSLLCVPGLSAGGIGEGQGAADIAGELAAQLGPDQGPEWREEVALLLEEAIAAGESPAALALTVASLGARSGSPDPRVLASDIVVLSSRVEDDLRRGRSVPMAGSLTRERWREMASTATGDTVRGDSTGGGRDTLSDLLGEVRSQSRGASQGLPSAVRSPATEMRPDLVNGVRDGSGGDDVGSSGNGRSDAGGGSPGS